MKNVTLLTLGVLCVIIDSEMGTTLPLLPGVKQLIPDVGATPPDQPPSPPSPPAVRPIPRLPLIVGPRPVFGPPPVGVPRVTLPGVAPAPPGLPIIRRPIEWPPRMPGPREEPIRTIEPMPIVRGPGIPAPPPSPVQGPGKPPVIKGPLPVIRPMPIELKPVDRPPTGPGEFSAWI